MLLSQEIDAIEGDEVSIEEYKVLILKYENLGYNCTPLLEDI